MQLQQLLALDFWGEGSNGNWVEAVICVAGVLDGSTLTYMFCDGDRQMERRSELLDTIGARGPRGDKKSRASARLLRERS
jgi:hypothetical protein